LVGARQDNHKLQKESAEAITEIWSLILSAGGQMPHRMDSRCPDLTLRSTASAMSSGNVMLNCWVVLVAWKIPLDRIDPSDKTAGEPVIFIIILE
jgi:hypothetical protein